MFLAELLITVLVRDDILETFTRAGNRCHYTDPLGLPAARVKVFFIFGDIK